jgi:hypothetical protein
MTALEDMARTGARIGGGKERVRDLRLDRADTDRRLGEGALVQGSAISLLLAASGRPVKPGELTGVGAVVLAERT